MTECLWFSLPAVFDCFLTAHITCYLSLLSSAFTATSTFRFRLAGVFLDFIDLLEIPGLEYFYILDVFTLANQRVKEQLRVHVVG